MSTGRIQWMEGHHPTWLSARAHGDRPQGWLVGYGYLGCAASKRAPHGQRKEEEEVLRPRHMCLQPAACSLQPAACSLRPAACGMRPAHPDG